MISIRRFKAIIIKEFIELFRDRRTITVMFLMPILQLILFTYAIQSDLRHFPLGWVDADKTSESRELRGKLTVSEHFAIKDFDNTSDADEALLAGDIRAIMVIPTDFARSITSRERARVQLLLDGSDPTLARSATGYIQAIVNSFYVNKVTENLPAGFEFNQPLDIRMRMLYNEDLSTVRFMVPGLLVYIIAFLTLVITSLAMVRELESGTLEQLFVTPVTKVEVIVGKLLPFGAVAIGIGSLVACAGWLFFGVVIRGSIVALVVVGVLFALSMLATGLFFSVISKTPIQAVQASMSINIPSMLISGFMFPIFTMPLFYRIASNLLPLTFALKAVRGIYLKGFTFVQCIQYMAILLLFIVFQIAVTTRLFKRRIG